MLWVASENLAVAPGFPEFFLNCILCFYPWVVIPTEFGLR